MKNTLRGTERLGNESMFKQGLPKLQWSPDTNPEVFYIFSGGSSRLLLAGAATLDSPPPLSWHVDHEVPPLSLVSFQEAKKKKKANSPRMVSTLPAIMPFLAVDQTFHNIRVGSQITSCMEWTDVKEQSPLFGFQTPNDGLDSEHPGPGVVHFALLRGSATPGEN